MIKNLNKKKTIKQIFYLLYGNMTECILVAITKDGVTMIAKSTFGVNSNPELLQYQPVLSCLLGIKVEVVVLVWNEIVLHQHVDEGQKFVYLLWSLYFLKNYNTEDIMGTNSEDATNTMRKWIWRTLESICKIQVVSVRGIV
jgi:hypothetical protein